jgi:hypothetical protein
MNHLPLAMVLSQSAVHRDALSARPDAPVVPDREHRPHEPRVRKTRTAVATVLRRTARIIEPADCAPAR